MSDVLKLLPEQQKNYHGWSFHPQLYRGSVEEYPNTSVTEAHQAVHKNSNSLYIKGDGYDFLMYFYLVGVACSA